MMLNQDNSFENDFLSTDSFKDTIEKYFGHWKWFLISFLIAFCSVFFYLRYAIPQYETNATLLIRDDHKGGIGSTSEFSAFQDLGIARGNGNIDNEIEVLKSRNLMTRVAKNL